MITINLKDNALSESLNKYPKNAADFSLMDSELVKYQLLNVTTFKKERSESSRSKDDKLILKVANDANGKCLGSTGNYCGVIYKKVNKDIIKFDIGSRFGSLFLLRMLGYANGVYLDDVSFSAYKSNNSESSPFILAFLFMQTLERAAMLGLPRRYEEKKEYGSSLRGQIDIATYLKKCVPFKGKIATKFREQKIDSDIASVLLKAINIIKRSYNDQAVAKLSGLIRLLKEQSFSRAWSNDVIQKAKYKTHSIPLFLPFAPVIEYAELIIMSYGIKDSVENGRADVAGYLIDVSSLFEIYLEKLLAQNLDGWSVLPQEKLDIYKGTFYAGNMKPDLILKNLKTDKVAIFDAKYKVMKMDYWDVDRPDLYQIHTYMSYFGKQVIAGGLLYPIQGIFDKNKAHSDNLFSQIDSSYQSKFIVDGVELQLDSHNISNIMSGEQAFIDRIKSCIEH
jgi:5-methylcytosine-specific restriction enzyme subunit McrC